MGSGRVAFLEERIRLSLGNIERLEADLAAEILLQKRFKKLRNAGDGTVISWRQKFNKRGLTYTFVALKIAGGWYTTSIFQTEKLTFDDLVDNHLQYAEEDVILKATNWKEA